VIRRYGPTAIGAVLVLVGVVLDADAVVLAGALAMLAGARNGDWVSTLVLAPALLAAAEAVPDLPHVEAAIVAALAAVALVLFGTSSEGVAIAALALGPLAVMSTRPAGAALAAGGYVAANLAQTPLGRLTLLAGLPGAVELVDTLGARRLTPTYAVMASGLAVLALLLAWRPQSRSVA
jgi:hypothetical protein